jgi:predicted acyltransferase
MGATLVEPLRRTTPPGAAVSPSPGPPPGARERLRSLDVFRGLTVAGMLLVNNPGSWGAIYPPLAHAAWNGGTPTDLIFPFFLFIVGITTELSLGGRRARGEPDRAIVRQVIRRGSLIFLFGLLLSWFPGFTWTAIDGVDAPSLLDRIVHRLEHLRIMGVLQRIGLAYAIAALLTLRTTLRQQLAIVATLLVGYWAAMMLLPVPGEGGAIGAQLLDQPGRVLSAWVDRTLLGVDHLWVGGKTWDPEGLLSTIPAVATAMLGSFAGRWIGRRQLPLPERLAGLFAVGALLMMAGLIWHWGFPINKSLWTSSYVLFTGGLAAVTLATCMWLIDHLGVTWGTGFFVVYGTNPMIAFLGSGLMARTMGSLIRWESAPGTMVSLQQTLFSAVYASWLSPVNASLAYAISFVLVWYAILAVLHQRGVVFKV